MVDRERALAKFVDDVFAFTELAIVDTEFPLTETCSDDSRGFKFGARGQRRKHFFPLSYLGPADPVVPELMNGNRLYFGDVLPRDVGGKWDITTISRPHVSFADGLFQVTRTRRVSPRELRGHRLYGEYITEQAVAVLHNDGTYTSVKTYASYVGKDSHGRGRWVSEGGSSILRGAGDSAVHLCMTRPEEDSETTAAINMALSAQFNRDYEWTVTISAKHGIPILLCTDPMGASQIFSSRDRVGDRKAALRHWVDQHWRQNRNDQESEVFVRSHLRGRTPFTWNALACEISPSPFDLRQADKAKQQREDLKHEGKTMRVRKNSARVDVVSALQGVK